ncbi:alcohol dehydrogenase catalytic domain-containing protein [Picrophilus oshimae]|uniref:Zinc-binding dehydrogenase n=1 Tax=Picrophilus torridus (strain ATCC 700027 / DSM 9790 / JCM 10055 / NBRC 100828 / KAW 2/3) TaxID=1122961 RepID=Q6KZW6_PICTO|nr:alcohol dehydrogenase catalytic domain-containing protein [Picrophilus oshimae]AAT43736.1 zinc-binding dehydrogenase [Picrophilus oshimae DSM 9789]
MKAAFLKKLNSELEIDDIEEPEPGDDEVVIEQRYTGICYRDILTMQGFQPRVNIPVIPGHEISGRIIKKGKNVESFNINERVSSLIYIPCGKCEFCLSGNENLCVNKRIFGESVNGAYRKYINVNMNSLVHVPDNVPEESSVIAACVTGMIIHALRLGNISEKKTVLITGAGGGVGMHAIEIAKTYGATVIAETTSEWKKKAIYEAGADYVVSGSYSKDVKNYGGADIVLEIVGKDTFNESLRSLKTGGSLVLIGNVRPASAEMPIGLIIMKGNRIIGSLSSTRKDVSEALQLSSEKRISPRIFDKVSLNDVNRAFDDMINKRNNGRILIDLNK